MPPQLALLLTLAFVGFLFLRERKENVRVTGALWIPLIWFLIIGSRLPSEWLGFGAASNLVDGSPLDGAVFICLELAGLFVLLRRRVSLSKIASWNMAMTAFLVYAALSILWSDFPLVALKRWLKILEHPIMALIVITEPDPRHALIRLMKRSTYVLFPFSVLMIKYYPELGRGFSAWTGEPINYGVTAGKNALGSICLVLGLFFVWHTIVTFRGKKTPERKRELLLCAAFLYMLCWLVTMANSKTALMALIVGSCAMLMLSVRFIDKKLISVYLVAGILLVAGADSIFGISDAILVALGRDETLTGRTELWNDVLTFRVNPLFGAGFESFWLGARLESLWQKHPWHPNQAHSGYLEMYLNLGYIGVALMAAWIVSAFRRANRLILSDLDQGLLRIAVVVSVLVYNYTEASFKALHPVWFSFFLLSMTYPRAKFFRAKGSPGGSRQAIASYTPWRSKLPSPITVAERADVETPK
jgi:exopolysaccharide production protein ExoQ